MAGQSQSFDRLLNLAGNTVFVGGAGTVLFECPPYRKWSIDRLTVNASTAVLEAVCSVYIGQVQPSSLADSSISGSSGDTSDTKYTLLSGDRLLVNWVGGDATATGYVTISGIETVYAI